ncbi:DNA primase [candidate division KSB1 bacterium]|nr:DNA primase [candidate division KSB1 bacterium]
MRISDEKIQEVRDATDIVSLISEYLTLKKRGKNFVGLCPFHNEKTPSFNVNPEKQFFNCFGCHKAGDIFNFIIEHEKITFLEAVQFLADRAGITIHTDESKQFTQEKEALYYANKFAANLFYQNLVSPIGREAMNYLQKRGFDHNIIRQFGLGYSTPGWDGLIQAAKKKSINPEILHKAGLAIKKDNGGYYDRFRGRVMIPIINLSKKVVGFGGRILQVQDNAPKYINSPETAIYHKGYMLYGLFRTREAIQQKNQAIFVEGYTDLISLYAHGIHNVVATLGTSLTDGQAKLIKRYTNHVVLLYDSDSAGSAASMRGADIFLGQGLNVKIIQLPDGEDPDTFIQSNGQESFAAFLQNAQSMLQFKIQQLERKSNDRTANIRSALESVVHIKDQIQQDIALQEVAEYFDISDGAIRTKFTYLQNIQTKQKINNNPEDEITIPKSRNEDRYQIAEEMIVRVCIQYPSYITKVNKSISLSDIEDLQLRELLEIIFTRFQTNKIVNQEIMMRKVSNPDLQKRLVFLLTIDYVNETGLEKNLNDDLILLQQRKLEKQVEEIVVKIQEGEKMKIDVSDLRKQWFDLRNERLKLEKKK